MSPLTQGLRYRAACDYYFGIATAEILSVGDVSVVSVCVMVQKQATIVVVVMCVVGCTTVWYYQHAEPERRCCESLVGKTERNIGGRQRVNGQWFSQTQPYHIHIYSAFFDSRRTLRSQSQLAVIGVLDRRLSLERRIWCHVWYSMVTVAVVVRAHLMPIGTGKLMADGSELVEHVFTCPLTTDLCVPVSVALAWGASLDQLTSFRVPVELSTWQQQQHDLAVCVSASFGHFDIRRLVEWLEMQQILGAQLIVIYNHSVSQSVGRILSQYADSDVSVELRQTRAFMSHDDALLHMSPVINDCMYRFSARFRYFAVIDLDEVIVPRHVHTIPVLVQLLSLQNKIPVALFAFRNAYFFLDIPIDDVERPSHWNAALSTYLLHRRRLTVSPPAYSVKSVINADACVAMHNHYCWAYTADVLSGYWTVRLEVAPYDALLHHYKLCHLDSYLKQRGHCKSVMLTTVVDNVINKYSSSLADRLYIRCVQFNLTTVS